MVVPLAEIIRDMYETEANGFTDTAASSSSIDDREREEISKASILRDLKEDHQNLVQSKDEPDSKLLTMDASFLYENNTNPCIYPSAALPLPFQRQYQNTSTMHFFNYPPVPYYGYNFMQQPNYIYPHHVQNNTESHNSLCISEGSAFTPLKPKYFSPKLVCETPIDTNQCKNIIKMPPTVIAPEKKKPQYGIIPVAETAVSPPSNSQSIQLKGIQEILSSTQIPIVSMHYCLKY